MRKRAPDALFIFVAPPSKDELVRRQVLRDGAVTDEDKAERLKIGETEMKHASEYDYVVINNAVDRALLTSAEGQDRVADALARAALDARADASR